MILQRQKSWLVKALDPPYGGAVKKDDDENRADSDDENDDEARGFRDAEDTDDEDDDDDGDSSDSKKDSDDDDDSSDSREDSDDDDDDDEEESVSARSDDLDDDDSSDSKEDSDDDDDDDDAVAAKAEDDPSVSDPKARRAKEAKRRRSRAAERQRQRALIEAQNNKSGMYRAIALGVLGIAIGVGGGWFLRDAKAKGKAPFAAPKAAASGELSGPCKTWQDKICAEAGDKSAGCAQAKSAAELMPFAACSAALEDVPGTIERLKQARAVCDTLVGKLCKDLGEESATCGMVKSKTANIPPENCRSMMGNYDSVIAQLKMLEKQQGMMGRGHPGGMRPGGGMRPMPPGGPQGGPPGGAPPPGGVRPVPVPGGLKKIPPGTPRVPVPAPKPPASTP